MRPSRKREAIDSSTGNHRARILAASAQAFLNEGFEATNTAEIARLAKVSKRELYSEFRDKRDILAAVITELQGEIQSQADVNWSSNGELRKVLIDAGTSILSFINSERFGKLFRIVAAESFHDPVSAQKFYALGPGAGRDRTAAFLKQHMKAGNLRKANPFQAADDFLDLVISARHLTAVVLGQFDETLQTGKRVAHAVDLFLHFYEASQSRLQSSKGAMRLRPGNLFTP